MNKSQENSIISINSGNRNKTETHYPYDLIKKGISIFVPLIEIRIKAQTSPDKRSFKEVYYLCSVFSFYDVSQDVPKGNC